MDVENHNNQIFIYGYEKLDEYFLPSQRDGRFWMFHDINKQRKKLMEVVVKKRKWYFIQNENCQIAQTTKHYVEVEIGKRYELTFYHTHILLFTFAYNNQHHRYISYSFHKQRILIGRAKDSDILYSYEAISAHHASLYYVGDELWIRDEGSRNGIYVNGQRIQQRKLEIKDMIQLLQMKILVSPTGIYINQIEQVTLKKSLIQTYMKQDRAAVRQHLPSFTWKELTALSFQKQKHKIDQYPPSFERQQMPLIFMLGPAITMGLSSLSMGVFTLLQSLQKGGDFTQSIPTLIMSFSMATGTILWPLLTRIYEKKRAGKQNQIRYTTYCAYLQNIHQEIYDEITSYENYLRKKDLTTKQYMDLFFQHIWVPVIKEDFHCTLGIAQISYEVEMDKPRKEFVIEKDVLQLELEKICKEQYVAKEVPAILDLTKYRYVCIKGEDSTTYVIDILLQLVLRYHKEINIVLCMDHISAHQKKLAFLPAIFSEDGTTRFLITQEQDGKYIQARVEEELQTSNTFFCLFVMDQYLAKKINIKSLLQYDHFVCFTLFDTYMDRISLPPCTLQVQKGIGKLRCETTMSFIYQLSDRYDSCAYLLSNLRKDTQDKKRLPTMFHFLEMYECANIEQLNIWERWKQSDVSTSLEVRIGINANHELLYLDAHERYHGPHGLFAGMTGSGKSECLLTYILSLAICYSPLDVSFLLIDYKGGTMAKSCAKLPHIAGIVTNLDDEMIERSCISLRSELNRRQQLFSHACLRYDVGNMNIETYRNLCKKHEELTKLSHLFIIADEFAELKSQHPEFLEQLKQSARIGRSLGIHLLLATQKPAGVIDDQIWSNAHFHLCMKVQSVQDSQDMLRKKDAAYLKRAGECCLQVGLDEVYEKGLIAWAQSSYIEKDELETPVYDEIALVHANGSIITSQHINPLSSTSNITQMEAIVKHIVSIAKKQKLHAQALWMAPLCESKYVLDYPSQVVLLDDIEHQQQFPISYKAFFPMHMLLFGKSFQDREAFLTSLLYQIIQEKSCNIYIFDLDQQHFTSFLNHPCICDVVIENQEEKVASFFYQIKEQIKTNTKQTLLIFHNYEAFHELYEEYENDILYLLREGEKHQIYSIISASNPNTVSFRLQQSISKIVSFQLHERNDYRMIFSEDIHFYPAQAGSGLLLYQKRMLNFQTLLTTQQEIDQLPIIDQSALQIPILPRQISYGVKEIKKGLYLGKNTNSKQDVYCHLIAHLHYVICAYSFFEPFLHLISQQLKNYRQDIYI